HFPRPCISLNGDVDVAQISFQTNTPLTLLFKTQGRGTSFEERGAASRTRPPFQPLECPKKHMKLVFRGYVQSVLIPCSATHCGQLVRGTKLKSRIPEQSVLRSSIN
ncbi:hypothetical protein J6590_079590, partial [Homalodisca vitripennis]